METKDALLHAINEEYVEAVEMLLEQEEQVHKPGEPHVRTCLDTRNFFLLPEIFFLLPEIGFLLPEIVFLLLDFFLVTSNCFCFLVPKIVSC